MGEVYKARDTRLDRTVAIKILPEAFAADADRVARFQREAKTLAALNHPNIAQIFGLEQAGDLHALAMEFVAGEDLSERIARGAMPISEAFPIARQIAEALEAAHEQGIVHRDLKPANVKVRDDGTVKVLDFGLAKAIDLAADAANPGTPHTHSPTITSPAMTAAGMILGTAAYMSPEQARGRATDKRSDVWAFGCVLFEMLTARRAFDGEDVTDTIAAVVRSEPDWQSLPKEMPESIRSLIRRCLEKDRHKRVGDISVARYLLAEPSAEIAAVPSAAQPARVISGPSRSGRALSLVVSMVIGAALAGTVAWRLRPAPPSAIVSRFMLTLPDDQRFTGLSRPVVAISPDGTQILYDANARLYIRPIGEIQARQITTTEALNPIFSPDGKSIAFYSAADQTIKRMSVSGGAAVTMCRAIPPSGMSWTDDGLLIGQGQDGIARVPAKGGTPETLVHVQDDELAHGPQILPGGEWILFTLVKGTGPDRWDRAQLVAESLKTRQRKIVVEVGSDGRYLPTGHLIYMLGGTLFAVPFDVRRVQVTGEPTPVIEGVRRVTAVTAASTHLSLSNAGSLVYLPGPVTTSSGQVIGLFDRKGSSQLLKMPPGPYSLPRISPDGTRVAFERDGNIGIYDLAGTSAIRRITFDGRSHAPIWSADGERVAFQSEREGDKGIWLQRADGTGAPERLTKPEPGTSHLAESWMPNGDRFLFSVTKGSAMSLWLFSLQDRQATPFGHVTTTTALFPQSAFSPDGKWVAYSSATEGGIFVQPFPPTGAKFEIHHKNGGHSVWSPDGKEIVYVPGGGQFVAVNVMTQPAFAVSDPVAVPRPFPLPGPASPRGYDVGKDGRFIAVIPAGTSPADRDNLQIEVVLNWFEELKAKVATK
jgi:serine/threonine protein kinase/Tol biopolymer transport system component